MSVMYIKQAELGRKQSRKLFRYSEVDSDIKFDRQENISAGFSISFKFSLASDDSS